MFLGALSGTGYQGEDELVIALSVSKGPVQLVRSSSPLLSHLSMLSTYLHEASGKKTDPFLRLPRLKDVSLPPVELMDESERGLSQRELEELWRKMGRGEKDVSISELSSRSSERDGRAFVEMSIAREEISRSSPFSFPSLPPVPFVFCVLQGAWLKMARDKRENRRIAPVPVAVKNAPKKLFAAYEEEEEEEEELKVVAVADKVRFFFFSLSFPFPHHLFLPFPSDITS